ncbi:hypothetical protein [Burkholderia cenocepacia]|uniref:hypothetical protein n=1 Tax=Burkholderia cenocepacia TaxID=95486 RepID=UPI000D0C66AE|nr:hypothetical protein [Burkholderia cenocepacia]SOT40443.1 conserved hypothetical protein [Burkholderia cenocepacia]
MDFENRIKKEMTEGIVKAILEDAGYRVIDSGIEKIIRELSCMSSFEYAKLAYPDAMSRLPDFTVMTKDQDDKFLVEVKYRSKWGKDLFEEIRPQVEIFGELVLVSINADPPNHKGLYYPSTYLRCCRVRYQDEKYSVQLKYEDDQVWRHYWKAVDELKEDSLWWAMSQLDKVFPLLKDRKLDAQNSLDSAIKALSGILK